VHISHPKPGVVVLALAVILAIVVIDFIVGVPSRPHGFTNVR